MCFFFSPGLPHSCLGAKLTRGRYLGPKITLTQRSRHERDRPLGLIGLPVT